VRAQPEQRWRAVVHQVWQRVDALTDAYLVAAAGLLPYATGSAAEVQARRRAHDAYEHMLRQLLELPLPTELADNPRRVAVAWARDGRPLDVLMQLTHLDHKMIWDALLRAGTEQDLAMLAVNADRVWSVVHGYALAAQAAYTEESALIARAQLDRQHQIVGQLMASRSPGQRTVAAAAAALDVGVDEVFAVVAVPPERRAALLELTGRLRASGVRVFTSDTAPQLVAVLALPPGRPGLPAGFDQLACAVAPPARGLAEVPLRAELARRAAQCLGGADGPRGLRELWPALVAQDVAGWAGQLRAEVLGPLDRRADVEAARVLDTVRAYLSTGSVSGTAAGLYCHRNTVVNRLRAFRELTGLDLSVPEHSAAVVVALALDCADGAAPG
jgi:hypothetical protein